MIATDPGFGFGEFLSGAPLIFKLVFLFILGIIAYTILRGVMTWTRNNHAPIESRACQVIGKRSEVWGGSGDSSARTSYFVTFEFDDRSRMELGIPDREYGLLAEDDRGMLIYQGTRYKSFHRSL
ncbi:DUF2500 domain-containing protein [Paenibacillus sp. GCM10023252]|uniref:DUF2500 domain-containing protein n=1 Tax=Paenibacillus sp. GCM10023252 TaxID=3252649 RepID=UPI00360D8EAA